MTYLNEIPSLEITKSICYPVNSPRTNFGNIFLMPTSTKDEFFKIANIFSIGTDSTFKVRSPKSILLYKTGILYYGTTKKRFTDKHYEDNKKEMINHGFPKSNYSYTGIGEYNGFVDLNQIISETKNITYTAANQINFWVNIIEASMPVTNHKKFLLFTKDTMKARISSISMINPKFGLNNMSNLYFNFLYVFKYHYLALRKLLVDNQIDIVVTDYKWTLVLKYTDLPLDSKMGEDLLSRFILRVAKFKIGAMLNEDDSSEEIVFHDEEGESLSEETKDRIDQDNKALLKVIEKLDKKGDGVLKRGGGSLETIESTQEIMNQGLKSADKQMKESSYIDVANIINDVLTSSKAVQKKAYSDSKRLYAVRKRLELIKSRNLTEIIANIEKDEENIIHKKVISNTTINNAINPNKRMNEFSIYSMDKQYEETLGKKTRVNIGDNLSKATVPLFMSNYKEKTDMNSPDTKAKIVSYQFQSPNNTKESHSFTVRVPELRDGKFLHINGSDKVMVRQKMSLPLIKMKDQVLFTSYFGKMFIKASRGNTSKKLAKARRFIRVLRKKYDYKILKDYFDFTPSYFGQSNLNYLTSELLELSRYMSSFSTKDGYNFISLSITDANTLNGKFHLAVIDGESYFCTINDEIENSKGEVIGVTELFSKLMPLIEVDNKEIANEWYNIVNKKETTSMAHSEVIILAKSTPLIIVLINAFDDSLLEVLNIMKRDYSLEFSIRPFENGKKPKRLYTDDEGNQLVFENFVVDLKFNNVANRVLLEYLNEIDLSGYNSLLLDGIAEELYDSRHVMNMENYRDFFIDNVATEQILDDLGIPSTYGEALLYANTYLFESNREITQTSLKNERMPSNAEIINGVLYKETTKAYIDYSNKVKRGSKNATFSVERDAVLKSLLTLPNVEESSKLNPAQHLDKTLTISGKGVSGVNDERAYTLPKRAWDTSFFGIMSDVSPYTKSTGISLHLSVNPRIDDMKGYFNKEPDDFSELNGSNLMSVSESLAPFAQKHDSAPRLGMLMSQTNHIVSTDHSEPSLVTYGFDESMVHLDTDFAHHMKDDGKVIMMNDRYIKVEYVNLKNDDGTPQVDVFNLDDVDRNSAKAKYIRNKMILNKSLKVKEGKLLPKDAVVAYNEAFYQEMGGDIIFKAGPIAYVAITSSQNCYEDSTTVTESLAKRLSSRTLKRVEVKLKPDYRIASVRDFGSIQPGDVLIKYAEDLGGAFASNKIDVDLLDDILMKTKKCNYEGSLKEIYVYTHLTEKEESELDPSIKKFIASVQKHYDSYDTNALAQGLPGYEKNRTLEHVTHFKGNRKAKMNGSTIYAGEIMIEFYIDTEMRFTGGDKVTFGASALKGVCNSVIPTEDAPIGSKTGRRIDAILSTNSPLARMVMSFFFTGVLNECAIKANNDIRKIVGLEEKKYAGQDEK